ncbi:ankyrin repeat domain-containing protein [Streptomyces nojiriensis]|uniref:ankyrin repeat domain-containing protein n=1 Tax=Streptomyces nojiriensis TaxID=66374 RepID=UPI0036552D7D
MRAAASTDRPTPGSSGPPARSVRRSDPPGAPARRAWTGGAGGRTRPSPPRSREGHHERARPTPARRGPNAPDSREDSPWLVTGVTGSVRMMRLLLPAGPDLKQRNRFGGISLIPAAERGHTAYVLDATDIDVDHVNRLGRTALLEAVILGDGGPRHEEVVAALLAAGADPLLPDHEGVTPYEHAVRRGFDGMARILKAAADAAEAGTGR